MLAVAVSCLLVLGAVAQAVSARRAAATAADLAALAVAARAAQQAPAPGPCAADLTSLAERVGVANRAHLGRCQINSDGTVVVTMGVRLSGLLGSIGPVSVSARAGPPPDG